MPTDAPAEQGGGVRGVVTRHVGPLPIWAWVVVGAGGFLGYKLLRRGSSGTPASSNVGGAITSVGQAGAAGAAGEPGAPGEPGGPGAPGEPGAVGALGAQGDTGSPGAPGPTGEPGAGGATGATGATGPAGTPGTAGTFPVGYTALLLQLTTALQSLARTEDAIAYYRTIGNPTLANQLAGSTGAATITGPTGVIYDTRSALNTLIDQLRTQLGAIK